MAMEVASGVHRFGSRFVNWYVVERGGRLTVVDAGFRGYWPQLPQAVRSLGRTLDDIDAVVLTHAHADHIGFGERLPATAGAALHVHEADAEPGLRRYPPLHLYWRPSSWPMAIHGVRMGLLGTPDVVKATAFTDGETLDVPGSLRVRHLPGHTRGSCALQLPEASVLFSGDALVTYDPYTRRRGPRLLVKGVNEDYALARSSLEELGRINAMTLLPGHGEPWYEGVAAAVAEARRGGQQPPTG
jgi:glyoxylase-like metal-dependent hydrolase (beta-lactamase superfamily II)